MRKPLNKWYGPYNQEKNIEELLHSYVAAFLLQCRWNIERAISIILSVVGYGGVLEYATFLKQGIEIIKSGEKQAIYLLPEIWGSGQGSELLRYALGKLKRMVLEIFVCG